MSISKENFIEYYVEQTNRGNVSLFLGAGVSASTGLPSWSLLLEPCAKQMGVSLDGSQDLYLLAQYYANEYGYSALKRVINDSLNRIDYESTLVDTLLALDFKSIWTTNFDRVIEQNLTRKKVLTNSIYDDKDLPNTTGHNRVSVYKLNGDISNLDRIVITQRDIENYSGNHEMLLTFFRRELVVNSFLFLGYSFTDDVVLSCLASVNRCLQDSANYHFTILKRNDTPEFLHFVKDLETRYHIRVLLINDYNELPEILRDLREAINRKNVFFSGVFERLPSEEDQFAETLCRELSNALLKEQYRIYTGYGRNFGNYLAGSSVQYLLEHNMEVDRYLIMRPFLKSMTSDEKRNHRDMMISDCKFAVFMFGQSPKGDTYINSSGMLKEYELAKERGKIIIPVGCTGYSAKIIWDDVRNHITLYPYLEKYIHILGCDFHMISSKQLTKTILQIMDDCN